MKIPTGIMMLADPIPGAGIRKLASTNEAAFENAGQTNTALSVVDTFFNPSRQATPHTPQRSTNQSNTNALTWNNLTYADVARLARQDADMTMLNRNGMWVQPDTSNARQAVYQTQPNHPEIQPTLRELDANPNRSYVVPRLDSNWTNRPIQRDDALNLTSLGMLTVGPGMSCMPVSNNLKFIGGRAMPTVGTALYAGDLGSKISDQWGTYAFLNDRTPAEINAGRTEGFNYAVQHYNPHSGWAQGSDYNPINWLRTSGTRDYWMPNTTQTVGNFVDGMSREQYEPFRKAWETSHRKSLLTGEKLTDLTNQLPDASKLPYAKIPKGTGNTGFTLDYDKSRGGWTQYTENSQGHRKMYDPLSKQHVWWDPKTNNVY